MKAMIFAAGLGTRLKPITDSIPKALVPIAGKTLLEHIILKLKKEGFDDIIINIHHFGEQIIDFLKTNNNFGISITISDEREMLLETGGGIKKAEWFFQDEPFLIHNVDILSNTNLRDIYNFHIQTNAAATLLVSQRETSRYLLFDENSNLKAWMNKQTKEVKTPFKNISLETLSPLAFSGIHVFSPKLFPYMDSFGDKFSVIDFYLSVCEYSTIKAFVPLNLKMIDVGKLNSLQDAEDLIKGTHICV